MPDVTQNVIIEFISDTSKLEPGIDQLERMGKVETDQAKAFKATNTEINKQADALKKVDTINQQIASTGKVTKKNVADLAQAVKGMSAEFQNEFKKGVIDSLKQAGVSVKDFEKALDGTGGSVVTLKSQLRQMVEELARLKVEGKDTSIEYQNLAKRAGELKDAIGDANQEVKNFGSDTSTIDGVIQTVGTLAGGFAVVQGAAALFGDESEELQKTLLKVNAAMAILQGLQQIQNALQKESAAAQLANTIATKAQAAAQVAFNFVVGTSTGLLKAFKIALATTGVGLLVIGLIELVKALQNSNDELENANKLIEDQSNLLDGLNKTLDQTESIEEARAKAAGTAESELIRIHGKRLVRERAALVESQKRLIAERDSVDATSEAWFKLNEQIEKNALLISGVDTQIIVASINLEKQLADERLEARKKRADDLKKAAEDAKKAREDALQKEKEARAAGFADFKASVELELLAVEKGSQEELEIKKRLLRAELQQALDNDKLTQNQRKLLIHKFFAERIELEKQFARDRDKIILENIASDIQTELQGLEVSNERKLELTETALRLQAQMEIDAAEGNAAKIDEINAKLAKSIRDARIQAIQEAVNYEISIAEATGGPGKRRLQAILEQSKIELSERISIINELATIDSDAIQKRINALNDERTQGLISQKDYNLQYAQLTDQQAQIWEDAEKRKTEATKEESRKRLEQTKKDIENIIKVADAINNILSGKADIQAQKENDKIAEDKKRIKELQDAGAITEKEAINRMKRVDAEEKKIRRDQAKREKELALFQAVINTARGIAEAIPNPFLIALAAAVGAAQIAIIAARPIPKFAKGKKSSYEGLGLVGEAGSELVESGGKMFITQKPEIVWLGKKDKVYSHKETIEMLSKPSMSTERNGAAVKTDKGVQIDYEKIGEAVGKHVQTNVFVDGIQEQAVKKKEFINYINSRRSF